MNSAFYSIPALLPRPCAITLKKRNISRCNNASLCRLINDYVSSIALPITIVSICLVQAVGATLPHIEPPTHQPVSEPASKPVNLSNEHGIVHQTIPRAVPATSSIQPPSPAETLRLFEQVQLWVRSGTFVVHETDVKEREGVFAGSYVTLRLAGEIVGRGSAFGDDGRTLTRATANALSEASRRLPRANTALDAQAASAMVRDISISLELSGELIPMLPKTYVDADLAVNRGVEGVAVTISGNTSGVFPMTMLLTDSAPSDALVAAIAQASGDASLAVKLDTNSQPPDLNKSKGALFYRFNTVHAAQENAKGPARFMFRGGRVFSDRDVSPAMMCGLSDNLITFLVRWSTSAEQWPLGTPHAQRGTYDRSPAELAEYAIVSYAVNRALSNRCDHAPELSEDVVQAIKSGALAYDRFSARIQSQQDTPRELTLFECALLALVEMSQLESLPPEQRTISPRLASFNSALSKMYSVETAPDGSDRGWDLQVPVQARAFCSFVLAKRAMLLPDQPDKPSYITSAKSAVRSVYLSTKPQQLVMHMPWLGWAELALAPSGDVPSSAALRDMRELVEKFQMTQSDAGAEGPDYIGGIVFTSSGSVFPTSHTLRPAAFLATMLGDNRLTDAQERMPHLVSMLSTTRYLRQLSMDEAACHVCPDMRNNLWGIRSSTWEYRQPPEASALALLTLVELRASLEKLSQTAADK